MSASAKKKHHSVLKVLTVLSICLYLAAFLLIIYDANIGGFLFGIMGQEHITTPTCQDGNMYFLNLHILDLHIQ